MKHRRESVSHDETAGHGRIGVLTFPGTSGDRDVARAVERAGGQVVELWHAEADLRDVEAVVLPGGASFGDYLRPGALAARTEIMKELHPAAESGLPILGIGNGFQVLCEAGLLPGTLARNAGLRRVSGEVGLRIENAESSWLNGYGLGQAVTWPLAATAARYYADEDSLDELEEHSRVVLRYTEPAADGDRSGGQLPPGQQRVASQRDVAGISSANGAVVGVMAHPELAIDTLAARHEPVHGSTASMSAARQRSGLGVFTSVLQALPVAPA